MDLMTFAQEPDLQLRRLKSMELKPGQIRTWVWKLETAQPGLERMEDLLSGDEVARAGSLKFERDRRRFIAARAGLRCLLGQVLEEAPEALRFDYSQRGKPSLEGQQGSLGLKFSLSHSGDLALAALARGMELGVDLEDSRQNPPVLEMAEVAFSAREREWLFAHSEPVRHGAFFELWTLKEAVLKAEGCGLAQGMRKFCVLPGTSGSASVLDYSNSQPIQGWQAFNFLPKPGFQAALAYKNLQPGGFDVASCQDFEYSC